MDWNWWVAIRHPKDIWENHPTFLIGEISFFLMGLLTLKHALRSGGRYPYLWLATVFHGITVESLSYFLPDIDNFWHAQSMVMLLGKRLPLHILFVYPAFIYTASASVSRLHLKRWAEPFAVGLAVVAFDIPFDIMGIKLLWWTWHDTDPNIFDRMYHVPWTSYYFHAAFASAFTIIFHNSRRLLSDREKFQSDGFLKEVICCLLTGMFSFPLGTLQFLPVYHSLHDNYNIHTEVCVFLLLAVYFMLIWTGDRHPEREARTMPNRGWFDEISLTIFAHFPLYIIFAFFAKPENNRSIGLHEPVGNCSATSPVMTAFGQILSKKTYLCLDDYDEKYFDFHCTKRPADGSEWYTVCGTAYSNHVEYCVVVTALSVLGMFIYTQMLARSGRQPKCRIIKPTTPKAKRN